MKAPLQAVKPLEGIKASDFRLKDFNPKSVFTCTKTGATGTIQIHAEKLWFAVGKTGKISIADLNNLILESKE